MRYSYSIIYFFLLLLPAKLWGIIAITGVVHNSAPSEPSCVDGNGSIDLTAQGNAGPFTYSWSNGQTTEDINGLCPNTYTVTVTNAFGCSKVLVANIYSCNQFVQPPTINNSSIIPVSSAGGSDGSINITVSGGWNLFYKWTKQGNSQVISTTQDINNLSGGTYCIEISGGCVQPITTCFTVIDCSLNSPPAPTLSFEVIGDNTYNNPPAPGSVNLTVQGGTPPYIYQWSTGATTEDITTTEGTRHVTVTDFCGKSVSGITAVTPCRGFYVLPHDNCGNYPELEFHSNWYMTHNSNEWINTIMPYYVNSPTFCDKVIHIDWPDGNHSTLNLDESHLVDPDEWVHIGPIDYDPDGVWDVPSSHFGNICVTISDNCGCRNTYCNFVGTAQNAGGWEWQLIGDVAPPLVGQTFPVITRCFECKVCSSPGQVPDINHMQMQDCSDITLTTLTYLNNDLANPCTGGSIHCPTLNTYYQVIDGAHGDPIVNWDAEPEYDLVTGMCIYPLGCLFPEGVVQGIDGPVYVENPNGYYIQNVNNDCEPPPPPQECNGTIIQDPNGLNSECEVPLICIPFGGGEPFPTGAVIRHWDACICNNIIIKVCEDRESSCESLGNLYTGPLPHDGIWPQEYLDFLDWVLINTDLLPYPALWQFWECLDPEPEPKPALPSVTNSRMDGIAEKTNAKPDLLISPNPGKNKVHAYSTMGNFRTLDLFDLSGQFICQWVISNESITQAIPLDLPINLKAGTYFIRAIFDDGSTKYAKFVKIE